MRPWPKRAAAFVETPDEILRGAGLRACAVRKQLKKRARAAPWPARSYAVIRLAAKSAAGDFRPIDLRRRGLQLLEALDIRLELRPHLRLLLRAGLDRLILHADFAQGLHQL